MHSHTHRSLSLPSPRDVKPDNILLDMSGHIRLAGWLLPTSQQQWHVKNPAPWDPEDTWLGELPGEQEAPGLVRRP